MSKVIIENNRIKVGSSTIKEMNVGSLPVKYAIAVDESKNQRVIYDRVTYDFAVVDRTDPVAAAGATISIPSNPSKKTHGNGVEENVPYSPTSVTVPANAGSSYSKNVTVTQDTSNLTDTFTYKVKAYNCSCNTDSSCTAHGYSCTCHSYTCKCVNTDNSCTAHGYSCTCDTSYTCKCVNTDNSCTAHGYSCTCNNYTCKCVGTDNSYNCVCVGTDSSCTAKGYSCTCHSYTCKCVGTDSSCTAKGYSCTCHNYNCLCVGTDNSCNAHGYACTCNSPYNCVCVGTDNSCTAHGYSCTCYSTYTCSCVNDTSCYQNGYSCTCYSSYTCACVGTDLSHICSCVGIDSSCTYKGCSSYAPSKTVTVSISYHNGRSDTVNMGVSLGYTGYPSDTSPTYNTIYGLSSSRSDMSVVTLTVPGTATTIYAKGFWQFSDSMTWLYNTYDNSTITSNNTASIYISAT